MILLLVGGFSVNKVMVAGVALIILIGAGAVGAVYGSDIVNWLRFGEKSSARQEKSLETIATLPVSEMYAEAQDRIAAGELNMALVILEGAAQRDHARSATAIGEMYDPARWGEIPSPFTKPDPIEARRWYAKATELGDPRAAELMASLSAWEEAQ